MNTNHLLFTFTDGNQAAMACDTLLELGYEARVSESGGTRAVEIELHQDDLTSALEIAQAHGGLLADTPRPAAAVLQDSYSLDQANGTSADSSMQEEADDEPYDHFSAGIHL